LYKGAQIFEILGLHEEVVSKYFVDTADLIQGVTFELLTMNALEFHEGMADLRHHYPGRYA